jgi:hypothetical protein
MELGDQSMVDSFVAMQTQDCRSYNDWTYFSAGALARPGVAVQPAQAAEFFAHTARVLRAR